MEDTSARGYFGIGVEGVSKSANVGALLRTGACVRGVVLLHDRRRLGFARRAAGRYRRHAGACAAVALPRVGALALPRGCALVGIEMLDGAIDLPSFRHPLNAAYVLGPERAGLSPALLARCGTWCGSDRFALNLAVAGALVLYDRLLQHGRFAERPVGSGGGVSAPAAKATGSPARHGPPRFRRVAPDWVDGNGA